MITSLKEIVQRAREAPLQKVSVAAPHDEEVLSALCTCYEENITEPVLVGDVRKIREVADKTCLPIKNFRMIDEPDDNKAAYRAVEIVKKGEADIVMKGKLHTAELLKAVLDKDMGLRTGRILSHIAILEVQDYERLIFLTDAGMNIAPDLQQKVEILNNAVDVARSLEINVPKVAAVAAVEVVNPNMEATIDAALLSKMAERGQIKNAIVDGPLAFDNAISREAAEHKGIESEVAGRADILLVPRIEVGNVMYKSLVYLAGAEVSGIIAGAKVPVVLTSRSDPHEAKVNSIATAVMMALTQK